jgi:hypothetical protein
LRTSTPANGATLITTSKFEYAATAAAATAATAAAAAAAA